MLHVSACSLYVDSEWCLIIIYTGSQCWIHSKHITADGQLNVTAVPLSYWTLVTSSRAGNCWPASFKYVAQ